MREILFRGMRCDTREFVFGTPIFYSDGTVVICKELQRNENVFNSTVGQYTGLTDKNSTKIFEADIVLVDGEYGVVGWDDEASRFMILVDGRIYAIALDRERGREVEVVGNIYDNPELLKGE